ncbi:hypothetical protein [Brevundimonas sp. Root1279]|uniref:hypothetical protein n=1 Tax=Brevundimonas sp. Root1279 TaxID=1736443 RepID=UPI0006F3DE9C|nr:hypothetical protein [Brevundimonas sp. Root1279]KQW80750.1 hypothetical protein ASC65_12295 [Brevundimonas sp. Root1279]
MHTTLKDFPRPLERAFALARSGECATKADIAKALHNEGYRGEELRQLHGPSLSRQLRDLCRANRPA